MCKKNLSQYVVGKSESFFLQEIYEMYAGIYQ